MGCLSNCDRNNISIKGVNLMKKTNHLVNTVVFSDCTVIESDRGTNLEIEDHAQKILNFRK